MSGRRIRRAQERGVSPAPRPLRTAVLAHPALTGAWPGFLLLVLGVLAWRSVNYFSGLEPGTDSGIFMSIGWHLKEGRVLYFEAWDHKPPLIFVLNALAQAAGGDGISAIRAMERVFAVVGVSAIFGAVWMGFGRVWLAAVAGMLFLLHFFELSVLEYGNVTEEYGAVFALCGVAAAIAALRYPKRSGVLAGLTGLAFSLAVFSKEPFLLVSLPWFLFLAWPRNGGWRAGIRRGGAFLLGALVPASASLGYLAWHGALPEWLDVLAYNLGHQANTIDRGDATWLGQWLGMAEQKVFRTLRLTQVAAVLGVVHVGVAAATRRPIALPLALAGSAVLGLFATSLSGGYSGHYYLFFVPFYVLLAASGMAFLMGSGRYPQRIIPALCLAALLGLNVAELRTFVRQLGAPAREWEGHWLASVIRANTGRSDLLWAPWKSMLNAEAGRPSPTRYLYTFDHLFRDTPGSTAADKYEVLGEELRRRPPEVVVLNAPPGTGRTRRDADAFLARSGLATWLAQEYRTIIGSGEDRFEVLVRKVPDPDGDHAALMREGLDALYRANDPLRAAFLFHQVLDILPTHYGGHFQLAKALDAAGQRTAARRVWAQVLPLSVAIEDTASIEAARARLAAPDAETPNGWLAAGLSCLHQLGDGPCAVQWFRRVLTQNPAHYGANFQLARALDASGAHAEATVQWQKVLLAAESVRDTATTRIARARLRPAR